MPRIRHPRAQGTADIARHGVNHHSINYNPTDAGRPCVATEHCRNEPVRDCPVRLCGEHIRDVYGFASDLIEANWDTAVREYVSELHATFKPPKEIKQPLAGWIYFVRLGDRVKVGYTTTPKQRLHAVPHEEVLGVIPGTREDETAWHRRLHDWHVVGEWFNAEPVVIAMIAAQLAA